MGSPKLQEAVLPKGTIYETWKKSILPSLRVIKISTETWNVFFPTLPHPNMPTLYPVTDGSSSAMLVNSGIVPYLCHWSPTTNHPCIKYEFFQAKLKKEIPRRTSLGKFPNTSMGETACTSHCKYAWGRRHARKAWVESLESTRQAKVLTASPSNEKRSLDGVGAQSELKTECSHSCLCHCLSYLVPSTEILKHGKLLLVIFAEISLKWVCLKAARC